VARRTSSKACTPRCSSSSPARRIGAEAADPTWASAALARVSTSGSICGTGAGRTGRHHVFDERLRVRAGERLRLERGLRDAMAADRLSLLYQPIVSLATGRKVDAEALLRYEDPERGVLAAAQFIDVAEDSGLTIPIGAWVLEQAAVSPDGRRFPPSRPRRARRAGDAAVRTHSSCPTPDVPTDDRQSGDPCRRARVDQRPHGGCGDRSGPRSRVSTRWSLPSRGNVGRRNTRDEPSLSKAAPMIPRIGCLSAVAVDRSACDAPRGWNTLPRR
jgi:hypothetical protein